MSTPTDYGEPWTLSIQKANIETAEGWELVDVMKSKLGVHHSQRLVACVNSMQGILDPEEWHKQTEAALSAAREALKYACRMLDAKEHDVEFAKSALALLTPTKP